MIPLPGKAEKLLKTGLWPKEERQKQFNFNQHLLQDLWAKFFHY
jgi:hypothetical protein